jgi:voltage-gated potassium channel
VPARARLISPARHGAIRRSVRAVRALWRDSRALWREFAGSVGVFLLATIGGGWLYGELLALAGYARLPFIRLPHLMLQMMILETPEQMPTEPYLAAFWYLMPMLAIFILGRGAADFVRLFFYREERRGAWEEAVASTYRDHEIVIGVGHVGLRVVRALAAMGFEVVAIERDPKAKAIEELNRMNIPLIVEDARDEATLQKAGLRYADSLVVCTSNDQTNLEVIMRARQMNRTIRIVARTWDSQFAAHMREFLHVNAVLSASDLAAPAFAGAAVGIEITQTLTIENVEYSMIRLIVEAGSFLEGRSIGVLQSENNMDIVLHGRAGKVEVQPSSSTVTSAGDTLVIFARHDQLIQIVGRNRRVRGNA